MLSEDNFVKSHILSSNVMSTVLNHLKLIKGEPGPCISPRLLIQASVSPFFSSLFFSVYLTCNVTKTPK